MNFVREQLRRSDFAAEIFVRIKLLSFRKHPIAREQVRRSDFDEEIFEQIKILPFRKHPIAREQVRQSDFGKEIFERIKLLPFRKHPPLPASRCGGAILTRRFLSVKDFIVW